MRQVYRGWGQRKECVCCLLDVVITCAALGNNGLVTAGWAAGAAGRLGNAPVAGAGAM